jgi:acyl-CoA dehydrogenase
MDAVRRLTVGAVDAGEKPAVLSAIAKAYLTEAMRSVVNDALDIRAGAAIMRGPRNVLSGAYNAVPIGITVEGANILTRSMIIYGQGAIRCHPFAQKEIEAVAADDLDAFDEAFFGHVGFVFSSAARSLLLGLGRGALGQGTAGKPGLRLQVARLTRLSSAFALVSDTAMATLGGELKRREKITGRLADVLAWLYLGSAALKRYHDEGELAEDLPLVRYSLKRALYEAEEALDGLLRNLPLRPAAWLLWPLVFPLGREEHGPSDRLGSEVAEALLACGDARERLTSGMYRPSPEELGLGRLEAALESARQALPVEKRIREALRSGRLERPGPGEEIARAAVEAQVISEHDLELLDEARALRDEVIAVDSFSPDAFGSA